jgi:drug/metabolite transporter (DMT)-like permease
MKSTDILRLLLLAAIWGSSYIFIRIVAPVMGVATTMGLRVIIAALFLTVIALLTRQYPLIKKFWWQYLFLGAFNLVIPTTLVVFSVVRLNASMSSVLLSTAPIFTLLISRIWL